MKIFKVSQILKFPDYPEYKNIWKTFQSTENLESQVLLLTSPVKFDISSLSTIQF